MIETLRVGNFKSLRDVSPGCRRINVIIGEPSTGKSNLLEAIGILSWLGHPGNLGMFVRMGAMADLFYAKDLSNQVHVSAGNLEARISFANGTYIVEAFLTKDGGRVSTGKLALDSDGRTPQSIPPAMIQEFGKFAFYRFPAGGIPSPSQDEGPLLPPDGRNLDAVIRADAGLREVARSILRQYGLKMVFVQPDNHIEVQMELEEDVVASFRLSTASDTIQRLLFNLAAVESNRDSVIALEEPEAHTFPYYVKYLAERTALDGKGDQFFITTHNPYFLLSVLEKAKRGEVAVHVTSFEDDQTRVRTLGDEALEEIMGEGVDVFFNLDELSSR